MLIFSLPPINPIPGHIPKGYVELQIEFPHFIVPRHCHSDPLHNKRHIVFPRPSWPVIITLYYLRIKALGPPSPGQGSSLAIIIILLLPGIPDHELCCGPDVELFLLKYMKWHSSTTLVFYNVFHLILYNRPVKFNSSTKNPTLFMGDKLLVGVLPGQFVVVVMKGSQSSQSSSVKCKGGIRNNHLQSNKYEKALKNI